MQLVSQVPPTIEHNFERIITNRSMFLSILTALQELRKKILPCSKFTAFCFNKLLSFSNFTLWQVQQKSHFCPQRRNDLQPTMQLDHFPFLSDIQLKRF